jgi:antitoxin (DNA-binding transcriptional repressor) of toxin-antitoxin stability system
MTTINMLDAKTNLSKLVEAIESGAETEIIIARNGKPAARLTALAPKKRTVKLGLAEGKFVVPDDFDADNEEIARLFFGEAE